MTSYERLDALILAVLVAEDPMDLGGALPAVRRDRIVAAIGERDART